MKFTCNFNMLHGGSFTLACFFLLAAVAAPSSASELTWIEVGKLVPSDSQPNAFFGDGPVAIEGHTAIVGASRDAEQGEDAGAAYVFTRDASGHWSEQAKLLASDGGPFFSFGLSADIDGNTVVVGTLEDDLQVSDNALYVFTSDRSGNWSEKAALRSRDGTFGDAFGSPAALDGDTLIVGATGSEHGTGSAYVFARDASGIWTERQKLVATDGEPGDGFGYTIDLDDDTAVIGRYPKIVPEGPGSDPGAAYVFTRDASGHWSEQAKLLPDVPNLLAFGWAVAIDRGTALIGGRTQRVTANSEYIVKEGAYVYSRDGAGVWRRRGKLMSSDGLSLSFGFALDGDTAILRGGGPLYDRAVYIFNRGASGSWVEQKVLPRSGASFSGGVAIDDDTAITGGTDEDGKEAVFVYRLTDNSVEAEINIRPHQESNNVNPSSRQLIAVAVLTTDTFDALQVDPLSVRFGPAAAREFHQRGHVRDIDKDGDIDLVLHFVMRNTGIVCGDKQAMLSGETFGGESITGLDSVRPGPCK